MTVTSQSSKAPSPATDPPIQDAEKQDGTDNTSIEDGAQQVLAWDDPREQRNPHNWSTLIRTIHTAIPCFLSFVM